LCFRVRVIAIGREGILKIYGDTDTLRSNIRRHEDQVSHLRELAALTKIEKEHVIYFSNRVVNEVMKTPQETQRNKLTDDIEQRKRVDKDEKLLGVNTRSDLRTNINCPIMSVVQDEKILEKLIMRGLKQPDAEHITQAICNECDVFRAGPRNLHSSLSEVSA
jgi:hypothetical protein